MKLVSAILPTRGRQEYARQAVECFLSQDYPRKELIILDDEDLPSFPQGIDFTWFHGLQEWDVIYRRHRGRSIAEKRNKCCELAQGEIICHFDSDDWSDPRRIQHQVDVMQESGKPVVGYHSMYFYSEDGRAFWYRGFPPYALGTSLMFMREWWREHPFRQPKTVWGEDNDFFKQAHDLEQFHSVEAGVMMVARIHSDNTAHKNTGAESVQFPTVDVALLPAGFPR